MGRRPSHRRSRKARVPSRGDGAARRAGSWLFDPLEA